VQHESSLTHCAGASLATVREDEGSVSLADIETVWDALHEQLGKLGLRVAGTRAVPLSRTETESGDLMELLLRLSGSS